MRTEAGAPLRGHHALAALPLRALPPGVVAAGALVLLLAVAVGEDFFILPLPTRLAHHVLVGRRGRPMAAAASPGLVVGLSPRSDLLRVLTEVHSVPRVVGRWRWRRFWFVFG